MHKHAELVKKGVCDL